MAFAIKVQTLHDNRSWWKPVENPSVILESAKRGDYRKQRKTQGKEAPFTSPLKQKELINPPLAQPDRAMAF